MIEKINEIKIFSKLIGNNIVNFQGTGGNISYKCNGNLYIKSSGYKIIDIANNNTLSKIDISGFENDVKKQNFLEENKLLNIIEQNNISDLKSSIETGFHLLIKSKYVIHTHNVYINVLLCMKGMDLIIKKLFNEKDITIIKYYSPGLGLFNAINNQDNLNKIIFLKNHGIILHGDKSFIDLYEKLNNIELIVRKYLKLYKFEKGGNIVRIRKHIFPDSIIINDVDICSAYNYIKNQIKLIGGQINYLSKDEVDYIKNMKTEKYRKKIFNKNYKG